MKPQINVASTDTMRRCIYCDTSETLAWELVKVAARTGGYIRPCAENPNEGHWHSFEAELNTDLQTNDGSYAVN